MIDEELVKRLRDMDGDSMSIKTLDEAADRIEALTAKLETCKRYLYAYAECDRIGTQAVRDLEAKLAKAMEALEVIRDRQYYGMGPGITSQVIARALLAEIEGEKG